MTEYLQNWKPHSRGNIMEVELKTTQQAVGYRPITSFQSVLCRCAPILEVLRCSREALYQRARLRLVKWKAAVQKVYFDTESETNFAITHYVLVVAKCELLAEYIGSGLLPFWYLLDINEGWYKHRSSWLRRRTKSSCTKTGYSHNTIGHNMWNSSHDALKWSIFVQLFCFRLVNKSSLPKIFLALKTQLSTDLWKQL